MVEYALSLTKQLNDTTMGTGNFYFRNASRVFAVGMDNTDEHDFLEMKGNITSNLEEKCKPSPFDFHKYNSKRSQFENRNFCETYLGTIYTEKMFGDISININCFTRAGYYEGACLDWELEINVDGSGDIDNTNDVVEQFVYCDSNKMNIGMLRIQARNAEKWAEKTVKGITELVELVFSECSDIQLNVMGHFSNGEAVYKEYKKEVAV
jgi:hypothetical protein